MILKVFSSEIFIFHVVLLANSNEVFSRGNDTDLTQVLR
jgi:hypothetical protein